MKLDYIFFSIIFIGALSFTSGQDHLDYLEKFFVRLNYSCISTDQGVSSPSSESNHLGKCDPDECGSVAKCAKACFHSLQCSSFEFQDNTSSSIKPLCVFYMEICSNPNYNSSLPFHYAIDRASVTTTVRPEEQAFPTISPLPTGPAGPAGPAGEKGSPGPPGLQGYSGSNGPPGSVGPDGLPGSLGQQGLRGDAGPRGETGNKGYVGNFGKPGVDGDPGPAGPAGNPGDPGGRGPPGSPGSQSNVGPPGPAGPQGTGGPIGGPGEKGDQGRQGIIGKQGPPPGEIPCAPGYDLLNSQTGFCEDINECAIDFGGCQHFCINTEGSYFCECMTGFELSPNNKTCLDIDECQRKIVSETCNSGFGQLCINTIGSYQCINLTEVYQMGNKYFEDERLRAAVVARKERSKPKDSSSANDPKAAAAAAGYDSQKKDPDILLNGWVIFILLIWLIILSVFLIILVFCLCLDRTSEKKGEKVYHQ